MTNVIVDNLLTKKLLIRQYAVEAVIHPLVEGGTFDPVWENQVEVRFGQTPVFFASLDHLIEMKRASGRPKDLQDLRYILDLERRGESDDGCGGEVLPEVNKDRGIHV
jgi:hypothetical protein